MDTELNGAGVGNPTAMPADNCCNACIAVPGCTGFVVVAGTCYLKSGTLTQTSLPDRTGYLRLGSPPPPPRRRPVGPNFGSIFTKLFFKFLRFN